MHYIDAQWKFVSSNDFAPSVVSTLSIAINSSGKPYVGIRNVNTGYATVLSYTTPPTPLSDWAIILAIVLISVLIIGKNQKVV